MSLRIDFKVFSSALIVSFLSASNQAQQPPNSAASIDSATRSAVYVGGDILTMRGTSPEYVEGLAIKDGKILFAGPRLEAQRLAGPDAKIVDLGGKTLLPGFIDTHGHFVYFGKNLVDANLFNCQSIEELISRMKKQA